MSKFGISLVLMAVSILPVQLSAYVGLTDSALKGDFEVVSSLVSKFNKQDDSEVVEQALEKVNEKITAIYAGKERGRDKIQLAKNIGKCVGKAALFSVSALIFHAMNEDLSYGGGLHHDDYYPAKIAATITVACIGLISAISTVRSVGVVADSINNPHRETTAYLNKLVAIREILKNFLKN